MDNQEIVENFDLLSKLMEIHGENIYKIRSYSNASLAIEKLNIPLAETPEEDLYKIRGIGDAIGKKILGMIRTGEFPLLNEYLEKTPAGVVEMLSVKGLGPKKILTIWKELQVESLGELLYACNENRLVSSKGFGEKSQETIRKSIEYYFSNRHLFRYADLEPAANSALRQLGEALGTVRVALTGDFRRQMPVVGEIQLVAACSGDTLRSAGMDIWSPVSGDGNALKFLIGGKYPVTVYCCPEEEFGKVLFSTTGSTAFLEEFALYQGSPGPLSASGEDALFQAAGVPPLPPAMREAGMLQRAIHSPGGQELITQNDIRGIIHCHSNWSDGTSSLDEMVTAAIARGYEYLVISDHSQSAFYAQGLKPERIREQHLLIGELNDKFAPFRIFRSIESDILSDGALDYSNELLSTFDLVIASVHSNLKMSLEKAMSRLETAISNPYTTILGHPTGRLLLSREGYPVDHERILRLCREKEVVVELNAHPSRLDLDWTWIPRALELGVMISIDPDAHTIPGFEDNRYGVLAAQKGGLTPRSNLSSFSREAFIGWLDMRKKRTRHG